VEQTGSETKSFATGSNRSGAEPQREFGLNVRERGWAGTGFCKRLAAGRGSREEGPLEPPYRFFAWRRELHTVIPGVFFFFSPRPFSSTGWPQQQLPRRNQAQGASDLLDGSFRAARAGCPRLVACRLRAQQAWRWGSEVGAVRSITRSEAVASTYPEAKARPLPIRQGFRPPHAGSHR